ncbi:MAG: NAD(P)/FAD-dependent oxidoreductase [Bacillota bacterium]
MLRITGIKVAIVKNQKEAIEKEILRKLKITRTQLLNYRIFKQSIDARKAEMIYFVYTVDVSVKDQNGTLKNSKGEVTVTPDLNYKYVQTGSQKIKTRPVIIGTGPAGLFCGLILAQMGYKPILLERGKDVETRTRDVEDFWLTGKLNTESNVQFGEGGAGTFSDGKLTTLIKNPRCRKVLEELICHGAPEEILYSYKPHIGTDILKDVVKKIRESIIGLGGEVRFNSKVTDLVSNNNSPKGVIINNKEVLESDVVVLAVGHSARDTFAMLYDRNVQLTTKAFAIGVRIEHPQEMINREQYGDFSEHESLGAADYKLTCHASTGRAAYSFCMCPGGVVVAAASEEDGVVTNGMSYFARDAENANSALLVGVGPADFDSNHPLAGIEFQRKWERLACELAGRDFSAPVQVLGDFLADIPSTSLGDVKSSYKPGIKFVELKKCLPPYVIDTLKEALPYFAKKIKGFDRADAVLTGVETRSSSPVRIIRDENFEANSFPGLYPCGEGAGYAGGIVSAAVDGIMVAEAIALKYKPIKKE